MKHRLFLCTCFFFLSCGNAPYRGSQISGADEFVMDSYQIREGKLSILQMEGKTLAPMEPTSLEEYDDLIQNGDILAISLYHPTRSDLVKAVQEISSFVGFPVSKEMITLPDIAPLTVGGKTLEEAAKTIQDAYQEEIRDVQVFLSYKDRVERKVELAGLVAVPSIPVDGRIRLFEVLAQAKVPPQANLFKSYLVRDNALVGVDFYRLLKEGDMTQNLVMRGGDKLYIADASASTIMVLGEVGQERSIDVPNGFITLRQALADAKGIPYTGNKSYIQIVRGNITNPKVYTLTWDHVVRLPSDSLLLIPGDIVYVAATPITEWNRFMTQLLPTLVNIDLIARGIKGIGVNVP